MDRSISIIAEIIINIIKPDRQVNYESTKYDDGQYLNCNETPFTDGLGVIHLLKDIPYIGASPDMEV